MAWSSSLIAANNSITLPSNIFNSIHKYHKCDDNDFKALFLLGDKCSMYLIPEKSNYNKIHTSNDYVFQWNLPISMCFNKVYDYDENFGNFLNVLFLPLVTSAIFDIIVSFLFAVLLLRTHEINK